MYINVSYDFKDILYIDEVEDFIRVTYTIQKEWYNSLLTFQNLKETSENLIYQDDKDIIWTPWIDANNVESLDKEKRANSKEIYKVVPNEDFNFKHNSKTNYQNALLFEE